MKEEEIRDYVEIAMEMTDIYGHSDGISVTYAADEDSDEIEILCRALSRFLIVKGFSGTCLSHVQHIDWNWIKSYPSQEALKSEWAKNMRVLVTLDDTFVDFDTWDGEKFEKYGDRVVAWADCITPYGGDPYDY